jgi:hypothetical protein
LTGLVCKSILSLIPGVALAFSTTVILNTYVLPILHYTCKSSSLLHKTKMSPLAMMTQS